MLHFPDSTAFGRRIPKQKFYDNLDVTAERRRLFVEQIRLITWANKLSPQTMNIAPGTDVEEIEVFHIILSGEELDPRILRLMDKQIPYHIIFLLERPAGDRQLRVGYKEAAQSGDNAFRVRQEYYTPWQPAGELELNLTALDMDALYESIVRQVAGDALQAPQAETLKEAVEQTQQREKLLREIEQLKAKMRKEQQLNKQMELRREIQKLEERINGA